LLFPQENRTYGISGINLCNLGAELSILRCRKHFRGVNYVKFVDIFGANLGKCFGANLGTSCIPYTV
jgi:hypothetical protein